MSLVRRFIAVVALLALAGAAMAWGQGDGDRAESERDRWVHDDWTYRLLVEAPGRQNRAGVNTARLPMADQAAHCRPDGADVRVSTRQGDPVPHKVLAGEEAGLSVEFQVAPEHKQFYVYYGNPNAQPADAEWERKLGGLTVEVRPTTGRVPAVMVSGRGGLDRSRRYVISRILLEVHRGRKPYGRRPWGQINDLENPLRPEEHGLVEQAEPDEFYLSIYKGTLLAPRAGDYDFAINADDAAIFGMDIDGETRWLCWRPEAGISPEWDDPEYPGTVLRNPENAHSRDKLALDWGLHQITYYHIENSGGQLAALAWEPPGTSGFELVPVSAFPKYLPVRVMGRQGQGPGRLTPYFRAVHLHNLRINGGDHLFPNYLFELADGWADGSSQPVECEWNLGDGATVQGHSVRHEYAGTGPFEVSLLATTPDGRTARVQRTLRPPAGPVHEMRMQIYLQAGEVLLEEADGQARLDLRVMLAAQNGSQREFEVVTEDRAASAASDRVMARRQVTIHPTTAQQKPKWHAVDARLNPGGRDAKLDVQLRLKGRTVASRQLLLASVGGALEGLTMDETRTLRNEDGALVRLVPAGTKRADAGQGKIASADGTVRVLVLDELLGGPPGESAAAGYVGMVRELLSQRYPGLEFKITRSAADGDVGTQPLTKLMHTVKTLREIDPHIVLLVWPLQSVVDGLPVEQFEPYLAATTDHLLARTRGEIFLVCTPPLPGHEATTRKYAAATKRTALRKGVKAVDLYSRFLLTDDWQSLFRSELKRYPSYTLYPGRQGQVEVAREIYVNILEFSHEKLAAAERAADLRRQAAP